MNGTDAYAEAGVSQRDADSAVEALVRSLKLIDTGKPGELDRDEPRRVAESIRSMDLRYATITGVTRDDLPDSGVALRQTGMSHPRAASLLNACAAVGLSHTSGHTGPRPGARLRFDTPRGALTLDVDLRLAR